MISADKLLQFQIDPVPKYRLLHDILRLPKDSPLLANAKKDVLNTKWVKDIIGLQQSNGSFGYFHSLSTSDKYPVTTEQALRRLKILGLDYSDLCIQKAVSYMEGYLSGEIDYPDRKEKQGDWANFTNLMSAAQISQFSPLSRIALDIADKWKNIIEYSFLCDEYSQEYYEEAYKSTFKVKPKGGRSIDFVNFYPLALLHGLLSKKTECKMLDYVINHSEGIYYIYEKSLNTLPVEFSSKQTNRYLNAVQLLSGYTCSKEKLSFVSKWLIDNLDEDGFWDMSSKVKDGIAYPLSNSWRSNLNRKIDCTVRIMSLLRKLE